MMFDEKMLSTLQKLGLTLYGAKTYIVITNFGPIDATKVAEEAGIPRTKIYDVLTKLDENGWINVEKGRPMLYTARDPRDIIDERKSDLSTKIDSLSSELSMMFDQQIKKEMPKVWLIHGKENIISKSLDLVTGARHSIMMLGDLYFKEEVESLRPIIFKSHSKGISFRILSKKIIKTNEGEIDLEKAFADVQPEMMITAENPPVKHVIVDEKEVLIIFPKIDEDVLDLNKVIALWIPSPVVASSMVDMFNLRWNEHTKMQIKP